MSDRLTVVRVYDDVPGRLVVVAKPYRKPKEPQMTNLTPRQAEYLDFIKYSLSMKISPTYHYIAGGMGVSRVTAFEIVRTLVEKGYLRLTGKRGATRRITLVESEPVYRIKPLVWTSISGDNELESSTVLGTIRVITADGVWGYAYSDGAGRKTITCKNRDAAKLAAESYYRERMMQAVEVTK